MASINKVILVGNVGRDPEVTKLENDRIRLSFSIATNDPYKRKDGTKNSKPEWHSIYLYGNLAELAKKHLKKGKQVYIEGRLISRPVEGKDGELFYSTYISGTVLIFLGVGTGKNEEMKNSNSLNESEKEIEEQKYFSFEEQPY